jgi:hypothetical protein
LVDVWLYRNDRQIKQVSYREEAHDPAGHGYRVTVRRFPADEAASSSTTGRRRGCVYPPVRREALVD